MELKGKLETVGIGVVLVLALLMFFAPLVSFRTAFAGDLSVNGYNVDARLGQLETNLDTSVSALLRPRNSNSSPAEQFLTTPPLLPFSLRIAWLASLLVSVAFGCAFLALVDLIFLRKSTGILSLIGGCCGVIPI